MADKSILDLTESTALTDTMFSIIEDGISSKKFKMKTLQDYIRLLLFINYYETQKSGADISLTDLLAISDSGDHPTKKTTIGSLIEAINRLNLFSDLPQKTSLSASDNMPLSDSAANNQRKRITIGDLLTFLKSTSGGLMKTDLSNKVRATQANVDGLLPTEMDYFISGVNFSFMGGFFKLAKTKNNRFFLVGIAEFTQKNGTYILPIPMSSAEPASFLAVTTFNPTIQGVANFNNMQSFNLNFNTNTMPVSAMLFGIGI